jgi:hypothetical protein
MSSQILIISPKTHVQSQAKRNADITVAAPSGPFCEPPLSSAPVPPSSHSCPPIYAQPAHLPAVATHAGPPDSPVVGAAAASNDSELDSARAVYAFVETQPAFGLGCYHPVGHGRGGVEKCEEARAVLAAH